MNNDKKIMYIEQKTDGNEFLQHRGPAIIARVSFSKTGKTIYFGNKSFYRIGSGIYGNYLCEETNDEYWISGCKNNGQDRHWGGAGPIKISKDVLEEYWSDIRSMPENKNRDEV